VEWNGTHNYELIPFLTIMHVIRNLMRPSAVHHIVTHVQHLMEAGATVSFRLAVVTSCAVIVTVSKGKDTR
jgi:uncharacterized membrane-anchored protein